MALRLNRRATARPAFGASLWRTLATAGVPWPRRTTAAALLIGVLVMHGCVADYMAQHMADFNLDVAMPPRIEVAYVRELEPSAPPAVAPAPPPAPPAAPRPRRAKAPAPAASAPLPGPEEPEQVAAAPEAEPEPEVPPGPPREVPTDDASVVAVPDAAASAPPFAWPASTRLSYVLTGNYRGEINGTAQVEWVRVGTRYQVHLDVTVGMRIAPLLTRRMTSDGQLTPEGLVPERYDEAQKRAFEAWRRSTIRFEPDAVVLAGGQRRDRWPGLQDAASQFVQLSYLFTTQPHLLATGQVLEVPLALPRSVDRWVYDVLEQETLSTPFGAVDAFHLKPRRVARRGGDLTAEIWFAPTLAYLPVRIRIHQDPETFVDLVIERKPQLAAN